MIEFSRTGRRWPRRHEVFLATERTEDTEGSGKSILVYAYILI